MQYTKGDWVVISNKYENDPKEIITGVGVELQEGYHEILFITILPDTDEEYIKQHDEIKANAKLIAAAPKLAEALQYYFDVLDEVRGKDWDKRPDHVLQKMLSAMSEAGLR